MNPLELTARVVKETVNYHVLEIQRDDSDKPAIGKIYVDKNQPIPAQITILTTK